MRSSYFITLFFLFLLSACAHSPPASRIASLQKPDRKPASVEKLRIVVGPLKPDPKTGSMGQLILVVCHDQKCYDQVGDKNADLQPTFMPLTNDQNMVSLDLQVEGGDCGIVIDHDRTNHGIENVPKCRFVYPKDGIGFSNNIDPRDEFGKPSWDSVKLNVVKSSQEIQIHPLYMCD